MGALGLGQSRLGEHPIHGGVVHPELLGNGAHPPFLDMKIAQDLRLQVLRDRHDALLRVVGQRPPLTLRAARLLTGC